jgi:peptidyl-prolyl cis-trans isomerase C
MKSLKLIPLVALLALVGCNKSATPPAATSATATAKPLAVVNGTPIERPMFDYFVKYAASKSTAELTPAVRNQLLDSLIAAVAVSQQAQKEGLDKTGDTPYVLEINRLQILQQADSERYLKDKPPTDAEIKAEYDAQVAAFPHTQYHARHILVTSQAQAAQIIDQLHKGAKFEDLAKQDSIDSSKAQGGDLGWIAPGSVVKPFADALANLKKGEVTAVPVQTQYGWHIIQMLDTRETPVPPLEQVKDQVAQYVQRKKFHAYEDQLLKTAKVERNTDALTSAATPVLAPAAPTPTPSPASAH